MKIYTFLDSYRADEHQYSFLITQKESGELIFSLNKDGQPSHKEFSLSLKKAVNFCEQGILVIRKKQQRVYVSNGEIYPDNAPEDYQGFSLALFEFGTVILYFTVNKDQLLLQLNETEVLRALVKIKKELEELALNNDKIYRSTLEEF